MPCLRGAIKMCCNSVWCTNGTDKTITSFFNVIFLYINTLLTFVKKFFNSSQIEFLGHVVEITTPWPATAHHHQKKARSAKVLLLMSKRVEVAGCQVGWVRWMRQLLKSDVLDYGLCNARQVRRSIIVQQQLTSGQHSPPLLLHCLTQICQHFTVVWSSHCCLLWQVIHQQHAFVIRENCGHDFPADVECGTSWVEESWRVSTAWTPVWCLDPSGESTFHHQLLDGTTRWPELQCR